MRDDELDHILSRETDIVPSSGFVNAVMGTIRTEAAAPQPIPFPWKRALPGFAAGAVAVIWLLIGILAMPAPEAGHYLYLHQFASRFGPWMETLQMIGAGWILLSLLVTLGAVRLSIRLAGGR
jgi:hypothetical protein